MRLSSIEEIDGNVRDAMGTRDADEMGRWMRGDGTAFEALVGRWQRPVARFLFRYTGRAELVPDLCQEVFLRVYQAGPRYREVGTFPGWLFRIALNVARDDGRRRRREPAPLTDAEPVDPAATAEVLCRRRELGSAMARMAAELPEPLRVVLALRHDEELSFEEIARLTGAPASTRQVALRGRPVAAAGASGTTGIRSRGSHAMNCPEVRAALPEYVYAALAARSARPDRRPSGGMPRVPAGSGGAGRVRRLLARRRPCAWTRRPCIARPPNGRRGDCGAGGALPWPPAPLRLYC